MKFISVLKLKNLPAGKKKRVTINGEEIMVANVDGKIYAVSDRCGHMGVSLSVGQMTGGEIECPLHGSIFDVETGKLIFDQPRKPLYRKIKRDFENLLEDFGIPPVQIKPLKVYPVEVRNGIIKVGVENSGNNKNNKNGKTGKKSKK